MADDTPITERVDRAQAALDAYTALVGPDGPEENLSDLLTDLMHWADANLPDDSDFETRLHLAEVNYSAEAEGDDEDHRARPDDDPEPGDRCKDCGEDITWLGPSQYDWAHIDEEA